MTPDLAGVSYDPSLGDMPVWLEIVQHSAGRLLPRGTEIALRWELAERLIGMGIAREIRRYRLAGGRYETDEEGDPLWA